MPDNPLDQRQQGRRVKAVAFFALQAHHAVPVGERTVCHTKQRLFLQRDRLAVGFFHRQQGGHRAHRLAHHADPRAVKSIYLCVFVNLLQPFQAIVAFQRTKGDVAALAFTLRLQVRYQHIEAQTQQHRQIFERTHPRIVVAVQKQNVVVSLS